MAYTTESKVENYLMIDIDSSLSSQVSLWISAVESFINRYTGQKDGFDSGSATVKYFDGNDKVEIDIDDCTEVTTVEILEANGSDIEYTLTEGLDNDYITYPYNETPIYRLILTSNAQIASFYGGEKRVKVTAKWGQATSVPADIELVATILVASIIEKGSKGGKISAESLGDYSVTYSDIEESAQVVNVKRILDSYKIFKL